MARNPETDKPELIGDIETLAEVRAELERVDLEHRTSLDGRPLDHLVYKLISIVSRMTEILEQPRLAPDHYMAIQSVGSDGAWEQSKPIALGDGYPTAEQFDEAIDYFIRPLRERWPEREWVASLFEVK